MNQTFSLPAMVLQRNRTGYPRWFCQSHTHRPAFDRFLAGTPKLSHKLKGLDASTSPGPGGDLRFIKETGQIITGCVIGMGLW